MKSIRSIFNGAKYKNKYSVEWCDLCHCAYIVCEACQNSSCNGGGCELCNVDFDEFTAAKIRVEEYLTEEEIKIVYKARRIQDFILDTLSESQVQIDFAKLNTEGRLSKIDKELFL